MRGKFITFEGGEGSGKTTHVKLLEEYLKSQGIECETYREPGGGLVAEMVRDIILDPNLNMDSMTELFLFIASRNEGVKRFVEPNLKAGRWIICDRFMDSSIVYQGIVRGLGISLVKQLHDMVLGETIPDLTIYLDVDAQVGLSRVASRGTKLNRLDNESLDFHIKVREGYRHLANLYRDRIVMLDSHLDNERLHKDVVNTVNVNFNLEKRKDNGN